MKIENDPLGIHNKECKLFWKNFLKATTQLRGELLSVADKGGEATSAWKYPQQTFIHKIVSYPITAQSSNAELWWLKNTDGSATPDRRVDKSPRYCFEAEGSGLPAHENANCSIVHGSGIKALSEYSDLVCFDECCLVHSLDQHLVMIIRQDRQNIAKSAILIQILKRSDRNIDLARRIRTKFWSLKFEVPNKSCAESEFIKKNVAIAICRTTEKSLISSLS